MRATATVVDEIVFEKPVVMAHPMPWDIRSQMPSTDHFFVLYHASLEKERGQVKDGAVEVEGVSEPAEKGVFRPTEEAEGGSTNEGRRTPPVRDEGGGSAGDTRQRKAVKPPPPKLPKNSPMKVTRSEGHKVLRTRDNRDAEDVQGKNQTLQSTQTHSPTSTTEFSAGTVSGRTRDGGKPSPSKEHETGMTECKERSVADVP